MNEEHFPAGSAVIREGESGDRLFLIARGTAEISMASPNGVVLLGSISAGEIFGELALLNPFALRQATVNSSSPLITLTLPGVIFQQTLSRYPKVKAAFGSLADTLAAAKFLKQATPFSKLDAARLKRLAAMLKRTVVPPGHVILRQGEPGEGCYLVRSGSVEVISERPDGSSHSLAVLGPGTLIGEAALLTDAPRNATVKARETTELLAIHRGDLKAALSSDRALNSQVLELLRLRDRPRRSPGVTVHSRSTSDGNTITIIKDPVRNVYFRLSEQGLFLWERLDGERNLRDLTLEYFSEFKVFSPPAVARIVGNLGKAGFLQAAHAKEKEQNRTWISLAKRLLDWNITISGIDAPLGRMYRWGVRYLFTRLGLAILAVLSVSGLILFAAMSFQMRAALHASATPIFYLLGAALLSTFIHEAGHAFAAKSFGYEIPKAGFGWYWFGPLAFVDASDLWLAPRRARLAVSAAGPAAEAALAGILCLIGAISGDLEFASKMWMAAMGIYGSALMNLSPVLECDGYYLLMDYLDFPNLRKHSLEWLGRPVKFKEHRTEFFYGICFVSYILVMGWLTVLFYRISFQDLLAKILPVSAASGAAYLFAGAITAASLAAVASEIRSLRQPD